MKKKISNKDIKDWLRFLNNDEKLFNKDTKQSRDEPTIKEKTIDLHGYSLSNANKIIDEFIRVCFLQKVNKITIITGKGSRSKNKVNPYQSENLSILKYSVPEYIKSNKTLMNFIKDINFRDVEDSSKGSFDIFLKKTKV